MMARRRYSAQAQKGLPQSKRVAVRANVEIANVEHAAACGYSERSCSTASEGTVENSTTATLSPVPSAESTTRRRSQRIATAKKAASLTPTKPLGYCGTLKASAGFELYRPGRASNATAKESPEQRTLQDASRSVTPADASISDDSPLSTNISMDDHEDFVSYYPNNSRRASAPTAARYSIVTMPERNDVHEDRHYALDEDRNRMVREYFRLNPIQDQERALEAYYQKHNDNYQPFDRGDDRPEYCICHKPIDGEVYMECDNLEDCLTRYYHPYCLGISRELLPPSGGTWFCHNCIREGRGGAVAFKQKLIDEYSRPRVMFRSRVDHRLMWDDSRGLYLKPEPGQPPQNDNRYAAALPTPNTHVNPWTADLDKKFLADPQNIRDLGIETLDTAKKNLRARAAQPLGRPEQVIPTVVNGTVVKQPNKNSWSKEEDAKLVAIVTEVDAQGLSGAPFWDVVGQKMKEAGMTRVVGAARNRWMRGLREATQIDERRKKNIAKLTTATQHNKDPVSTSKRGKKRQGDRPRVTFADELPFVGPAPAPQFAAPYGRGSYGYFGAAQSPVGLLQPQQMPTASSPLRPSAAHKFDVDDEDDALTDIEDMKDALKRKHRPHFE